ncbi:Glucan_synthase domain-containing protein/FKS1_dom1 domain-containing protein [Cephalotus follicularis]|uniref:1,3-beta-glucan synthase n=1 Tax=Cephalotus follicularis TaxID=3775 RepID=A0A1Q3D7W3_CEPFO|nr:Glucan_synthase domain-containing protein/FKS1_dom1 domain-containing protein [Cephalotus follicularis]
MNLRQRPASTRVNAPMREVYNIIPVHDLLADHPSLRYPEVRAAASALHAVGDLRKPPFLQWTPHMDLLDWLGSFFGFQRDNVRNQREHLVLHLANSQMRLSPPPANADALDPMVLRRFRRKLLQNYSSWCSYLGRRSQIHLSGSHRKIRGDDLRRELLYVSLYLLIWGESANLRFVPECLCYIYHFMAMEMNQILDDDYIDANTGRNFLPSISGENAFLKCVVMPLYQTIRTEMEDSRNGTKPHSGWRNYDDINEYFWSRRCFEKLKWPIDFTCNFFANVDKKKRVGKTGFVEQRSFWNIFRSFDRVWVLLILFFQASVIVAWSGADNPLQALESRNVQVELLTVFITWGGLRLWQSILDAGTQYSLVSRETKLLGVRMVLKILDALTWTIVFGIFYGMIWSQKNADKGWSPEANGRILMFLKAALVFLIPELLATALFIIPWIRNLIEELDWNIMYVLTWWFHTRTFVGRGLREGILNNAKYTLFWIMVLISKFSFSYFLQIKPLVAPTKALLDLKGVKYKWHEFFGSTKEVAVVFLWLPVIFIYFMDLQIWYSVFSSIVGATVGLFLHLGEIRNIEQLRLRFQFFASAMQFNLMPEEQPPGPQLTLVKKLREAIHRLKLRYGLGQAYKKMESSQVDTTRFAIIWNEIVITLREEDLISDREFELLELPPNCWNIRVIRWPCCLLCNELLLAISQSTELANAPDPWLWQKICNSEYMRCAVIESYDSIKYLLLMVVKDGTEENSIVTNLFREIDNYVHIGKFTEAYKLSLLPQIHTKLISLVEQLLKPEKDISKTVNILQALYELSVREFPKVKRSIAQLRQEGLAPLNAATDEGLLFENAVKFPDAEDDIFIRHLRRLHTILTSRDAMHNVPVNLEARRRFAFFSNSLFMNMPLAPFVEKMMAFSVLTPYYDEEVVYGKESLRSENEDGISTLFYLQKIYEDEWRNFMERMHREGIEFDDEIWSKKARDLRLWASYRGQTLSRTVRGMMYYYRALKMLAYLDSASEKDIRMGSQKLASQGSLMQNRGVDGTRTPASEKLGRATSGVSLLFKGDESGSVLMKFTYVVTCQVYGQHKAKGDPRAEDILYLMKSNEALRVAYVDEVEVGRSEYEYYSVLVKYDQQLQREMEIYRIRLPGPLKLGEGKPENQNHAIIFTRGDALQTIDMNQDNYFEEALKMRNLLEEYKTYYGIRRPTILGVRENIITGSVSSLARFMSAQEMSFVTLGQRVLANPLKVRMHYGHPDVFDRFWFLPRGGISKASKVINISEDIFAGFNCTLRGGNVTHHEYIQVGKGRDVGLNQISMFEAKVASGNGEQVLSRDVYRLGHRLDFFRMLSFYYTTVGFFFNTMMVVLTVYTFLWGRLYLALSGIEKVAMDNSSNNKALGTILNQQFIIQLGLFTALPMIMENYLEQGFLPAVWNFVTMQLQLASLFYTFSMGTRTHFFGRTILHGGAKYRATGRGFVVQHKSFVENYRLYARSHFVKAIELGVILVVYASYSPLAKNTFVYIAMTISSWFLVVSWIMSPFVFNPSGFDWLKTVYDFDDFVNWIWYGGGMLTKAEQSWETWWYEEQDHLRTTGLWGKLLEIILDLRFFFFQFSVVYQLRITNGSTSITVYFLSWIFLVVALGVYVIIAYARDKYSAKEHIYYRLFQLMIIVLTVLVIVILLEFTELKFFDILTSLMAFIPTGWGLISIALVLRPFLQSTVVWDTVVSLARLYDLLFGVIVMAPVALLAWLPGFQSMQTRVLFNEAFSRGLQISRIISGKKSN